MEERGTLQETADWLDTQLATFAGLIAELGALFSDAWAAIQPQNLPDLLDEPRRRSRSARSASSLRVVDVRGDAHR